ncbi:tRNA/rRNA methyltransferase [Pseudarthrobacter siccitolerans]|uniref:tRNA/rRNA methyltransferase n=1 Tax=Pseudarthrobacter siccitolerans TaxID=861266 RepID=A0A024H3L4_9MICC|nr:tRNA/rRNA methyltransferase [Pseudarthrobacter siccitolerans]
MRADLARAGQLVHACVRAADVAPVGSEWHGFDAVEVRGLVQPNERICVLPVSAGCVPTIDYRNRGIRMREDPVGEDHPRCPSADHQIVGFDAPAHAPTVNPAVCAGESSGGAPSSGLTTAPPASRQWLSLPNRLQHSPRSAVPKYKGRKPLSYEDDHGSRFLRTLQITRTLGRFSGVPRPSASTLSWSRHSAPTRSTDVPSASRWARCFRSRGPGSNRGLGTLRYSRKRAISWPVCRSVKVPSPLMSW